jgi:hypothetical protein
MTAEQVPTWLLAAGDVIRIRHHHDSRCGECRAQWETEAVVADKPVPVSGRLAVNWTAGVRLSVGGAAVTGVSVFSPDEPVVRIGRLPAGGGSGLTPAVCGMASHVVPVVVRGVAEPWWPVASGRAQMHVSREPVSFVTGRYSK